jgi:hypothetical protein
MDSVSSGERKRKQPKPGFVPGLRGLEGLQNRSQRKRLESRAKEGESPVCDGNRSPLRGFPE